VSDYFVSGRAADVILLILAAEFLWLVLSRRLTVVDAIGLIVPGMLIVAALRFALTGAAWPWIAAPLALALPFHAVDLWRRVRR
jgi:hypothetical protein